MPIEVPAISNNHADDVVDAQDGSAAPPKRQRQKAYLSNHMVLFVLCTGAITASFLLNVTPGKSVASPGLGVPLPSVCQFRNWTGLDCPGCGLTRGFVSIAHGDFGAAWKYNAASVLVFALAAFQIPYRAMQIWRIRRGKPEFQLPRIMTSLLWIVVAALLLQWIVKLTVNALGY